MSGSCVTENEVPEFPENVKKGASDGDVGAQDDEETDVGEDDCDWDELSEPLEETTVSRLASLSAHGF